MKKVKWPALPSLLVPLFECAHIYLCTSCNEWEQAYEAMSIESDDVRSLAGCVRLVECAETGEVTIILGVFTGQLEVLVHECAHVAFRICSLCGVEINPDGSNETYCYLLDKVFRFAEPFISKSKTNRKLEKATRSL
ncbi:hypothetical protein CBU97_08225 [Salmonella enterica subsp. enterica serovar Montevideo]|nr:hypothetical protein [Salmonella enterica]ECH4009975.1 hypothetical protein [Salmonella enterica subsp. enterica serovar Montevideo]EBM1330906.1 hypothetical protein [Salmonella enterica]ECT8738499.1 hypothetical protein [Salmonella enterica subsp. enterica serovar Montevideo]EDH6962545.1 hypothetical protein [Salmonella enterica subsp. enterica serovar Montevideo]